MGRKAEKPIRVPVRLDAEEHQFLVAQAQIAGKPIAEFIRGLIHESAGEEQVRKDIDEAWAAACDASSPLEYRRAALLALAGKVAAKSMSLRGGYMPMREFGQAVSQILAISGLPSSHVKITEESRSMNAHVHTSSEKTWEEMVDESHSRHPQPGRALPHAGDASDPAGDVVEAVALSVREPARAAAGQQ